MKAAAGRSIPRRAGHAHNSRAAYTLGWGQKEEMRDNREMRGQQECLLRKCPPHNQ